MRKKPLTYRILNMAGIIALAIILILSIWQPVFPGSWLLKQMVKTIDPRNIAAVQPAVIRFELSGKGGGIYNIVAENNQVKLLEGETDRMDLIIYMKAADFNTLIYSTAFGKADESRVLRLILSNVLNFAGDMTVFKKLFSS